LLLILLFPAVVVVSNLCRVGVLRKRFEEG
jgi:hypothetical protein